MGNEESVATEIQKRYASIYAIGGTKYYATRYTAKTISINDDNFKYNSIRMDKTKNIPKSTVTHPQQQNNGNKDFGRAPGKPNNSQQTPQLAKGGVVANKGNHPNETKSRNLSSNSQDSFGAGAKIVNRKLWWHESESEKKIDTGGAEHLISPVHR